MKKTKLNVLLALITLIVLAFSPISFADNETDSTENETTENQTVSDSAEGIEPTSDDVDSLDEDNEDLEATETEEIEQHKGSYREFGDNVTIDKAIDGNAYVFGNTVKITGQINGDLWVFANELRFEEGSAVLGNVFAFSSDMTLNGLVYNLYSISDKFTCEYNGMAALDLRVFANDISFSGYVERSLYFVAGNSLTLTEDAYVLGNFTYYTNAEPSISDNAAIAGETFANKLETPSVPQSEQIITYIVALLASLTFISIVYLILVARKSNAIENITNRFANKYLSTFGIGFATLILVPVVAFLLLFIDVLVPMAFLLFVLYCVVLAFSTLAMTLVIAQKLDQKITKTKSDKSLYIYILLVTVVLWVIDFIPVIGGLVSFIVMTLGLGTIVRFILLKNNDNNTPTPVETEKEPKLEEKKDDDKKVKKEDKKSEKKDDNKSDNNSDKKD